MDKNEINETRGGTDARDCVPRLVRVSCCWLSDSGRKCRNTATTTKKVHADSMGVYAGQWFKVPVCDRHK